MSEIRQNKGTRDWVIFAPGRRLRPHDTGTETTPHSQLPERDPGCPFCPGNEHLLPGIIMELPAMGQPPFSRGETREMEPSMGQPPFSRGEKIVAVPWQTRVVPNRYPALRPEGDTARSTRGIYVSMPGYGKHEIVIESPYHNRHHAEMSVEEVSAIIETYHRRYQELMKAHENAMILIFRNHGERAGTSLAHPHSQIIVTGVIPNHMRHREEEARRYYDDLGRCVYCDILEFELKERRRVVFENTSFLGYVPFAASAPFEVIIMPRRHAAGFGQVTETEKTDLSQALRDILARLSRKLNDPDYNYVIYTSDRFTTNEPQLHWFLEITPRLTTRAGFEIGTGININPSMPEEDADFLNQPD